MRRMSFALTTEQFRARRKTVTRRFGWAFAVPGMRVVGVEKAMGFRRGEKGPPPIHVIEFTNCQWERVDAVTDADVALEGFPGQNAAWFVEHLCRHAGKRPDDLVNRLAFRYVEDA